MTLVVFALSLDFACIAVLALSVRSLARRIDLVVAAVIGLTGPRG